MQEFLKDSVSQLLVVAVLAIFGSISQTAMQGKDISRVADSIEEMKSQLKENYDQNDAEEDKNDVERELEIVNKDILEAENRLNSRIDILDDRITRMTEALD